MRRSVNLSAGLIAVLALWAVVPATAGAAVSKYYTLTLTPQSVVSGQRTTISATISNVSVSSIGSANITAPANFALVSATVPRGTAVVAGSTAQLRGLNIPRGGSLVATLVVDPPCSPVTGAKWSAVAKPPADFKGGALSPQGGQLTTSTTGTCDLAFTVPPADAQTFQTVTGVPGDPDGPAVAVGILDGAGEPVSDRSVSMALGTAPAGATLGGTAVASSVAGVATFGDLFVDTPGVYTLTASTPGLSATPEPFVVHQGLTACIVDTLCTASASTTGTIPGSDPPASYTNVVSLDAPDNPDTANDDGTLWVSYNIGPDIACGGYDPASPDREVFAGPNRAKTVQSLISGALLAAQGRSPSSLRTCILLPYAFSLGPGLPDAPNVGDVDGDGNDDYLGLLPDCPAAGSMGPCQVGVSTGASGDATVVYILPPSTLDPIARH